MEITANVRRGDFSQMARPAFWQANQIKHLKDFYGVHHKSDNEAEYSPFLTGLSEKAKPWMGIREGNEFTPESSVCTSVVRPTSAAPTDALSYPFTAVTSRPRTSKQPNVEIVRQVIVDEKTVTEERIAMLSILAENEQLRRMCGELQRVVDRTVQSIQNVSEDAKNVAYMAQQLAEMQLTAGDGEQQKMDTPCSLHQGVWDRLQIHEDGDLSVETHGCNDEKRAGTDILRIDTPTSNKKDRMQGAASEESANHGKPLHGISSKVTRNGWHTARDDIRPGTASFTPRIKTPQSILTPRKQPNPLLVGGETQPLPLAKMLGSRRPGTAASGAHVEGGHLERVRSRPLTAQSTSAEQMKRQVLLCFLSSWHTIYHFFCSDILVLEPQELLCDKCSAPGVACHDRAIY
jgi:hypothetical protein